MNDYNDPFGPRNAAEALIFAREARRVDAEIAAYKRGIRAETFTALLSCKPLDVEMRRLQRAALRRLKNKGKR
jgi:hypothetical protein